MPNTYSHVRYVLRDLPALQDSTMWACHACHAANPPECGGAIEQRHLPDGRVVDTCGDCPPQPCDHVEAAAVDVPAGQYSWGDLTIVLPHARRMTPKWWDQPNVQCGSCGSTGRVDTAPGEHGLIGTAPCPECMQAALSCGELRGAVRYASLGVEVQFRACGFVQYCGPIRTEPPHDPLHEDDGPPPDYVQDSLLPMVAHAALCWPAWSLEGLRHEDDAAVFTLWGNDGQVRLRLERV
jgi:hypothetical protein